MEFTQEQAQAFDMIADLLKRVGVDIANEHLAPKPEFAEPPLAVIGKAGSGKTLLLAEVVKALREAGLEIVSGDYESRKPQEGRRSVAILAPTNKAASVLRNRAVPATTIHRILYTPSYDPEYEKIAEWLIGNSERPETDIVTEEELDKVFAYYEANPSVPAAFAAIGKRGSDFILGWKKRTEALDIGLVDESSMLDNTIFEDLRERFSALILFGDPAQLAPVNQSGSMVFDAVKEPQKLFLSRVMRQASDNPILDLAHDLAAPEFQFEDFERAIERHARHDERIQLSERVDADLMAVSPVLVWRNATRIRLISAFRKAFEAPERDLLPGEPLICDGIELPIKHRKKRLDLEARGLIKGAQVIYLGQGRKAGFSRLHVIGADEPQLSAASIIQIEQPDMDEPLLISAARMGALFLHGAAVTIHKAQGSQWKDVQIFAPDLYAAARMNRSEAGIPLWKRLAYVALTRAEERVHWVTQYKMKKPNQALQLPKVEVASPLVLEMEEKD